MIKMMKDGRTYNTDTATLVHYREGCGGDRYQGLYQTRDGEFFFWEYDSGEGWGNIRPLQPTKRRTSGLRSMLLIF